MQNNFLHIKVQYKFISYVIFWQSQKNIEKNLKESIQDLHLSDLSSVDLVKRLLFTLTLMECVGD